MLGHDSCVAVGGDLGGGVIQDLALRFEGFIERLVIFNSVLPLLGEAYAEAGLSTDLSPVTRAAADYFVRQGRDADGGSQRKGFTSPIVGCRCATSPTFPPSRGKIASRPAASGRT